MRGIVTAGGGHGWETRVVAALGQPGAPVTVVRRCADMADVLAVASTGQIVACLLAADLRRLDSESVHQLTLFGVAVVAIHRAGDSRAAGALERIGVAVALPDDSDPDAIVAAVQRAAAGSGDAGPIGHGRNGVPPTGDPSDTSPPSTEPPPANSPPRAEPADRAAGIGAAADAAADVAADVADGADEPARAARHRSPGLLRRRRDRRATEPEPRGPTRAAAARQPGRASADTPPRVPDPAAPPGRVIAVWGPTGAPGRSTVAMGLADRFAAAGERVLLVDADVYGGILASAFGLLDESAGLAGACRLAAHGRLDDGELAQLCWAVSERLALLTGIARADRWPELRPSAIPTVLDVARMRADIVIVDCAAVLETDEEITFDTMAPRRNGATIAALRDADLVLAVGSADPPGMERLARGMAELVGTLDAPAPGMADAAGVSRSGASASTSASAAGAAVPVVLNRVRPGAATPAELTEATRRFCGREPIALLQEDRAGCDLAWRRGVPVAEVAPKSPLVRGLGELSTRLGALLSTTSYPTRRPGRPRPVAAR